MSDTEAGTGPGTHPGGRFPAGSAGRQARAERILDATAGLLQRHGYKRVTVDDVAAAAGVGKGTIYLHWKTREALFWAVLQRETVQMLEQILADLEHDPGLGMPGALMRAIFLQTARRPLVRALLLADPDVLGGLAQDEAVAAAQAELAGNEDYLEMVREHGLLRPGLTAASAGYVLGSVMRGFFAGQSGPGQHSSGSGGGLRLGEQADLLADVLRHSLETGQVPAPEKVAALAARVRGLFTAIVTVQRGQLERAYG
ncbi:MAG: helix-turn-helix domain-containing protein [Streptosporangiaceae bacterium]